MEPEEFKKEVEARLMGSISGLIKRGPIPRGVGHHFSKHCDDNQQWIGAGASPAATIYTYSVQEISFIAEEGHRMSAAEMVAAKILAKDLEEYRKLCVVNTINGDLGQLMDECEENLIRDGGGDERFFWVMSPNGSMTLFHPLVMKRLSLDDEDWFGTFTKITDGWGCRMKFAYQPVMPRYGYHLSVN